MRSVKCVVAQSRHMRIQCTCATMVVWDIRVTITVTPGVMAATLLSPPTNHGCVPHALLVHSVLNKQQHMYMFSAQRSHYVAEWMAILVPAS